MTYPAYKGYFLDGRFVSPDAVYIPENTMVYVMVVGDESAQQISDPEEQMLPAENKYARLAAFDKFTSAIAAIDDEPITDEDLADFEHNRVNFRRELGL